MVFNLAEKKFLNASLILVATDTGTNPLRLSLLNHLVIGTAADANSRIGNKVRVHYISFGLDISPRIQMGQTGALCKILVIKSKLAGVEGMAPWTSIFDGNGNQELRNTALQQKYIIKKNYDHAMNGTGGTPGTTTILLGGRQIFRFTVPVNQIIGYKSSTITAGNTTYSPGGGGPLDTAVPNKYVIGQGGQPNNLLNDDYQLLIASTDAQCCQVTINWKIVFSDA